MAGSVQVALSLWSGGDGSDTKEANDSPKSERLSCNEDPPRPPIV